MGPEVTDAMTWSFLVKLSPGVAERLTAEGERVDYARERQSPNAGLLAPSRVSRG